MWFGLGDDVGVELPPELVSAHAEGSLVMFVGAGASVDPPSCLPTFEELTGKLLEESHLPPPRDDLALERQLGDLDRNGVNVHLRVSEIIGSPNSQPNTLHMAIAGLALASPEPRLVTTNYDRHLSACLTDLSDNGINEFPSLAFPQRDGFTGIVYLHGSVKEPPEHLVVTDAGFGQAYLEAPWTAAQFLSRVFRQNTVLFIGYSHNDTLMEYLARSLPTESGNRYALCDDQQVMSESWQDRGIQPIRYGSHEALPLLLEKWAERSRMGALDHERRAKEIVQGTPPLSREDESYLEETVESPERLRFFTENAQGIEWLRWAGQRPGFLAIFDPRTERRHPDPWTKWFIENYAFGGNSGARREALRVFRNSGGRFSPSLWQSLASRAGMLLQNGGDAAKDTKKWFPLLIDQAPAEGDHLLERLLEDCDLQEDRHEALLLLDCLLEPEASDFIDDLAFPRSDRLDMFRYSWNGTVKPCLAETDLAVDIAVIVDHHLRAAHRIAAASRNEEGISDALSFARSAIEDHEQDQWKHDWLDALITVARDVLEALLEHSPECAPHYLRSWGDSPVTLLRRLAVHGWAERQDVTPNRKIAELCQAGWLFEPYLRHEAMRLAAVALPQATPESIDRLVELITAGDPGAPEQNTPEATERADWIAFIWLEWITRHAPEAENGRRAVAAIKERHPDWQRYEHMDFLSWTTVESKESLFQGDPDDLHKKIGHDPAGAIRHLLGFSARGDPWSGEPSWEDALHWLENTVKAYPTDGIQVLDLLTGADPPDDQQAGQQVAETVLRALAGAELSGDSSRALTERLTDIWDASTAHWLAGTGITGSSLGPLTHAINHWAGHLAEIALRLIDHEYKSTEGEWAGLPDELRPALEAMASGSGIASQLAQVLLASRISFLFQTDDPWCRANILPLLDPEEDTERAIRCWDGYLMNRPGPTKLLEIGLLDMYVAMAEHLGSHRGDTGNHFHLRLAEVAIFSGINPIEQGWLDRYTATAEEHSRVRWIKQVSYGLAHLPTSAADAQWDSWMREYWANRLRSVPRAMTDSEATALVDWAVCLGDRFPEAADLACRHKASVSEHSMAIRELNRTDYQPEAVNHIAAHPEHAARLVTHLLANTDAAPFTAGATLAGDSLSEVVSELLGSIGSELARPLREQATRLGIATGES